MNRCKHCIITKHQENDIDFSCSLKPNQTAAFEFCLKVKQKDPRVQVLPNFLCNFVQNQMQCPFFEED